MGGRKLARFLFVQVYLHALARQPEGGFTARKTRAQKRQSQTAESVKKCLHDRVPP